MPPITWKNVAAPEFSGVSNILDRAGQSVQKGLTGVENILNDEQERLAGNREAEIENNTNAFLDAARSKYTTSEALQAAEASGELDALRRQFVGSTGIDRTRGGVDAIAGIAEGLETEERSDLQFEQQQADRDYVIGERNRTQQLREKREELDRVIGDRLRNVIARNNERTKAEQLFVEEYFEGTGIDPKKLGDKAYLDQRTPEELQLITNFNNETDQFAPLNFEEIRSELLQELLDPSSGYSTSDVLATVNSLDESVLSTSQLSKTAQANLSKQESAIESQYAKNSLVQWRNSDESIADASKKILDNVQETIDSTFFTDNKQGITKQVNDALENGVLVDGRLVMLSPPILERLLKNSSMNRLVNDGLEKVIQDYYEESKDGNNFIQNEINGLEEYRTKKNALSTKRALSSGQSGFSRNLVSPDFNASDILKRRADAAAAARAKAQETPRPNASRAPISILGANL